MEIKDLYYFYMNRHGYDFILKDNTPYEKPNKPLDSFCNKLDNRPSKPKSEYWEPPRLTERQYVICDYIKAGYTIDVICKKLNISLATYKKEIRDIREKS